MADDDVDSLLSMVQDATGSGSGVQAPAAAGAAAAAPEEPAAPAERCTYLCLGSAATPQGLTRSLAARRACPQQRCTACDFPVLQFRGAGAWVAGVDYLFFRNVYPDRAKLAARLSPDAGSVAYCCQCSWVTVAPADGALLARRPAGAVPPEGAAAARVGGQGWAHWVCAGGHA
jgi:hypothetical protein